MMRSEKIQTSRGRRGDDRPEDPAVRADQAARSTTGNRYEVGIFERPSGRTVRCVTQVSASAEARQKEFSP